MDASQKVVALVSAITGDEGPADAVDESMMEAFHTILGDGVTMNELLDMLVSAIGTIAAFAEILSRLTGVTPHEILLETLER